MAAMTDSSLQFLQRRVGFSALVQDVLRFQAAKAQPRGYAIRCADSFVFLRTMAQPCQIAAARCADQAQLCSRFCPPL
jgi:hypothetical protein